MTRFARRVALAGFERCFFKSPRAIATFESQGRLTSDPKAVGLSRIECANAATVLKVEQTLGCAG